jgi:hypothetical protein
MCHDEVFGPNSRFLKVCLLIHAVIGYARLLENDKETYNGSPR